jgi:hypothetical protein
VLTLTSIAAGGRPAATATAAPARPYLQLPKLTPHAHDWFIESQNAWDVPAGDGSTDLYAAEVGADGPGILGGSPTDVEMFCAVFHHWNPAGFGSFTTVDEGSVAYFSSFPPGPPAYVVGYGQVSGADASTASQSVYAGLHVAAESPDFYNYFIPEAPVRGAQPVESLAPPGYVQGVATTQNPLHFDNGFFPPYPDSGTITISIRGVIEHQTFNSFPFIFSDGAIQCQLAHQPTDVAGSEFVFEQPQFNMASEGFPG